MVDGLDRLRHDVVVGCDDDDGHVGDFRTPCTHGRKGFVTRRIEEGDFPTVVQRYAVRSDVLGNTSGFTRDDVRLPDVVEQRGFTVVDVSHDRNDRRTRNEILFLVHLRIDCLLNLDGDEFDLEAELFALR